MQCDMQRTVQWTGHVILGDAAVVSQFEHAVQRKAPEGKLSCVPLRHLRA
jgi:hypothetical protein